MANDFGCVDYTVFGLTLLVSLGIGLFYACTGGKQKTNEEYLMGDRNLSIIPVAISLLVSFISGIGILGTPAEMYAYGTQFSMYIIAAIIGCFFGAFLFVPLFYPLKLTSSFEYLELRYKSVWPRLIGTCIMLLTSIFTNATCLFAPSTAFDAVTGFPTWLSMSLTGVVGTIYTCLGGMKAVIWTDVFQSIVIFGGMIAVVTVGVLRVGGFGEVWRLNDEWGRIEFFNFDPDPRVRTTFWSIVVMMSILWTCITATQVAVQRYCALPTQRKAKASVLLNIPGFILIGSLTCLCGVVVFAYYAKEGCDPMTSGRLKNPNQLLPYFVLDAMGLPGLPGLFVACLYSGALSTLSSTLNAMAAVTWEDFMKWKLHSLKPETQTTIAKVLVAFYGALSLGVAFLVEQMGGTFIQIVFTVMGTTAGPLVGMFFLGGFYAKAGPGGCILGGIVGLTASVWMATGSYALGIHEPPLPLPSENCPKPNLTMALNTTLVGVPGTNMTHVNGTYGAAPMGAFGPRELHGLENFYAVSYLWYPAVGIFFVAIIGVLTSCIPGLRQRGRVSKKYLFPIVHCCYRKGRFNALDTDDEEEEEAEEEEKNGLRKDMPWKGSESPIYQLKSKKMYPLLSDKKNSIETSDRL